MLVFAGVVWVWLGGTLLLLVPNCSGRGWLVGLARCWVLRRHLRVLFSGSTSGLAGLTHGVFVWWRLRGWGVVVC